MEREKNLFALLGSLLWSPEADLCSACSLIVLKLGCRPCRAQARVPLLSCGRLPTQATTPLPQLGAWSRPRAPELHGATLTICHLEVTGVRLAEPLAGAVKTRPSVRGCDGIELWGRGSRRWVLPWQEAPCWGTLCGEQPRPQRPGCCPVWKP